MKYLEGDNVYYFTNHIDKCVVDLGVDFTPEMRNDLDVYFGRTLIDYLLPNDRYVSTHNRVLKALSGIDSKIMTQEEIEHIAGKGFNTTVNFRDIVYDSQSTFFHRKMDIVPYWKKVYSDG